MNRGLKLKRIIIGHGPGIRINKQDPKDLYEKLQLILADSELYETLSINAKKTIVEQYDISNYIVQLNEIYKSAIN